MTDNPNLADAISRLVSLKERRARLDDAIAEATALILADAAPGDVFTHDGQPVFKVVAARRFDAQHARTVLTDEQIEAITVPVIDRGRAETILPPALYDACKVTGRPQLRPLS